MIPEPGRVPQTEGQSERGLLSAGRVPAPEGQSDRASLRTAVHTQVMCRIGRFKIKNTMSPQ